MGIAASLDQTQIDTPERVDLVGLSTTLATNALVEGKGPGPAFCSSATIQNWSDVFLGLAPIGLLQAATTCGDGEGALNERELRRTVEAMVNEVEVIAISQMGSGEPQHEQRAQAFIEQHYDIPAIAGHEISTEMDSMRRATTVFWNARLIPILLGLMEAVEKVLCAGASMLPYSWSAVTAP